MSASPPLPPPRSVFARDLGPIESITKSQGKLQLASYSDQQHLCITRSLLVVLAVEARQDELFSPIQEPRRQSSLAYLSTSETWSHKQADIRITTSCSLLVWSYLGLSNSSSIWIESLGLLAIGSRHPGVRPLSRSSIMPRNAQTSKLTSLSLSLPPSCFLYSIELI